LSRDLQESGKDKHRTMGCQRIDPLALLLPPALDGVSNGRMTLSVQPQPAERSPDPGEKCRQRSLGLPILVPPIFNGACQTLLVGGHTTLRFLFAQAREYDVSVDSVLAYFAICHARKLPAW